MFYGVVVKKIEQWQKFLCGSKIQEEENNSTKKE